MNTSTTTRGLRVAAVVAAATGSVLAGGGAAQANEAAGHFSEAGISCYSNPHYPGNNQVVVQPPAMSGAAATDSRTCPVQSPPPSCPRPIRTPATTATTASVASTAVPARSRERRRCRPVT